MKCKALEKDFDNAEVQAIPFDMTKLWSARAYAEYGEPSDTHPEIAARFDAENPALVLDIGCGTGSLQRALRAPWVGIDRSIRQLDQAPRPAMLADALHLPFRAESFDAAASIYTLYFFDDPGLVAAEARRVLKPGGMFATCAPSRFDCPEINHFAPRHDLEAFAAEDIAPLLNEHFTAVEITEWNFPFIELRDGDTARDYIYFFFFPTLTLDESAELAATLTMPLEVTKLGAWGIGRKA
jgi:ubiquinone/menaquinone biosynthesis C-methylase UbiE